MDRFEEKRRRDSYNRRLARKLGEHEHRIAAIARGRQVAFSDVPVESVDEAGQVVESNVSVPDLVSEATLDVAALERDIDEAQERLVVAGEALAELNDVTLPALDGRLVESEAAVAAAEGRLVTAEGELTDLTTNVLPGLTGALDDVQGEVSDHATRMLAAEQAVADAEQAVAAAEGELATLTGSTLPALDARLGSAESAVSGAESRLTDAEAELSSLDTNLGTVSGNVSDLIGRVGTVESGVSDAQSAASAADAKADQAKSDAATAKSAADDAAQAALNAAGIANGKGKVIFQATAPTGADRDVNNLWIRSSDNKPHRWLDSEWVTVTDKAATDAATAASTAQTAAQNADAKAVAAQGTADQAKSAAATALSAAQAADGKAVLAQQSADGKSTVTYGTSKKASGAAGKEGDTHYVFSGSNLIATQRRTATAWVDASLGHQIIGSVDLGKATVGQLDGQYIKADTITGGKILAGSVTAADAVFGNGAIQNADIGNLNAVKINAGTLAAARIGANSIDATKISSYNLTTANATIGNAVVKDAAIASLNATKINAGTLDAARIGANSITAEKLIIGSSSNLIPNGAGEAGNNSGWAEKMTWQTADKPATEAGAFQITAGQTSGTSSDPGFWDVEPGKAYRFEVWLKADKPNSRIFIECRDVDGAHAGTSTAIPGEPYAGGGSYLVSSQVVPTTWTKYAGIWTPNAGSTRVKIGSLYFNHTNGTERGAVQMIAGMRMQPMTGATLIEDGAVTTTKVAAEAITGSKIKAGSITATHGVFATGAIQNADIGNLNATKINAGTLNAARIGADTIEGKHIKGGSITATHGVFATGAIQSADIGSINANTITVGTLRGIDITGVNITGSSNIETSGTFSVTRGGVNVLTVFPDGIELGSDVTPLTSHWFQTNYGDLSSDPEDTYLSITRQEYTDPSHNTTAGGAQLVDFGQRRNVNSSPTVTRFSARMVSVDSETVNTGSLVVETGSNGLIPGWTKAGILLPRTGDVPSKTSGGALTAPRIEGPGFGGGATDSDLRMTIRKAVLGSGFIDSEDRTIVSPVITGNATINGSPIPRMATGSVYTGNDPGPGANQTHNISFPPGRFTSPPLIQVTSVNTFGRALVSVDNITTSGARVVTQRIGSGWASGEAHWFATQS